MNEPVLRSTEPRVAAFFDFDRTIIRGDGGVQFGKELIHIFTRRLLEQRPGTLGWFWRLFAWRMRIVRFVLWSVAARILYQLRIIKRSVLVNIGYSALKGLQVEELRYLARDFVDEVLVKQAYPAAMQRMAWHRAQGHVVVVATTNMRLLVEHFSRHLPLDDVIGVELLERDGRATGKVRGPTYGAEKAVAIREWAHRNNVSLPRSYAYTDHYSDHFILPLVGHPHVVNPSRRLRRLARRRRWSILDFRLPPAPLPSPPAP